MLTDWQTDRHTHDHAGIRSFLADDLKRGGGGDGYEADHDDGDDDDDDDDDDDESDMKLLWENWDELQKHYTCFQTYIYNIYNYDIHLL